MSTKDAYKKKIEAELELVQANLQVLKAKAKNTVADMRINYDKEISTIEENYAIMQSKLNELAKSSEGAWEHLKEEIERSWTSLRAYAKKIPDNISKSTKEIK